MKRSPYKIFPPRPAAGRVSLNGWWALWEQKRRRSRMSVSVPPFVPPGSALWLNGWNLGLGDGDAVSFWPDDSGSALNASQDVASAQPICRGVTFAGREFVVARFDTVDDGMATTASIFGGSPFSVFVMWRPADLGTTSAVVCSANIDWRIGTYGGQMVCYFEGLAAQAAVNTNDFYLVEVRLTPGQDYAWAYLNGVQTGIVGPGAGTSPPGQVALGASGTAGLPGGCDLAELLMYNRGLSDDEVAGVRAHFQEKYNFLKL